MKLLQMTVLPCVSVSIVFSTTRVERPAPFNFVNLHIPSNPFYSLANNVVPAVVLDEVVEMISLAMHAPEWRSASEVVSGLPHWFTMRVLCHLLTAERLVRFLTEYQSALPDADRDLLIATFRDPGTGFDREDLTHTARSSHPDHVLAAARLRTERRLRPGAFGMLIARQIADELVYNERGNEVLLIKHLR